MREFPPCSIENYIVKYCVNVGNGLGRVKNKKSTLKRLKDMLVEPMLDTSVTFAQYMALDQDAKLAKKSAPGYWLAAHFRDGRRKLDHQLNRTMGVLDLDYVTIKQLDYVRMGFAEINQYYWIMHTTRAHCPEKPRVRVIIPCSRPMDATETNAITRLLSLQLADDPDEAIEIPDLVSFRYNQAMFKPSISRGQEYWLDDNPAGVILDVDAFLADNPGWDDYTQLPYQEAEKQRGVVDPSRKMENPHEKPGIIGAWCRTYDVEEAIAEFLSDTYIPGTSDTETRYSFAFGTGSNGAVVYDGGLFLHSNHGSDPAEGLHNSFDLVRLHKFGHLDDKAPASTGPGNMPSFKSMSAFAREDDDVKADLLSGGVFGDDWDDDDDDGPGKSPTPPKKPSDKPANKPSKTPTRELSIDELLAQSSGDDDDDDGGDDTGFDDYAEDADEPETEKAVKWQSRLVLDQQDKLEKSLHNCATIVRNHKKIAPCIALNDLDGGPYLRGTFKFPKADITQQPVLNKMDGRRMTDNDTAALMCAIAAPKKMGGYATQFTRQDVEMALLQAAEKNRYNPFLDKINAVEWDGVPRLATFFHDWFGAEDNEYHSELGIIWFVAGVARQYEPGHRFDLVPILGGKQGGGKTGAIEALGMGYGGSLSGDFSSTQKMTESTKGKTVIEVPELKGMSKSEIEDVKGYFTATKDTIRLAYRRNEEDFYRRCVYMGTTNQSNYLRDEENRRFCPVLTDTSRYKKIDFPRFLPSIPQFWAEAQHIFFAMRAEQPEGFLPLEFTSNAAKAEAERLQKESREVMAHEPVAEVIEQWLNAPLSAQQALTGDDGMFDDDDDDDGKGPVYVRNLVTVTMIRVELANTPPQPYLDLSRPEIVMRVAAAECLRRAFASLDESPVGSKSTHGAFGKAAEWDTVYKPDIAAWLATDPGVDLVGASLCYLAPLADGEPNRIMNYCRSQLADQVSGVVADGRYIQVELSERLATAGVLPMFGFPTQSRNLFKFKKDGKLEDMVLSDRALDHAIWAFSPGSEIPKDKQIHTACGFELLREIRGRVESDPDPLGPSLAFSKCSDPECAHIMQGMHETCEVCTQFAMQFDLYQPKGFITTPGQPRDYDGQRQRGPSLSPPVLAFKPDYANGFALGPARVALASDEPIALVNDNGGELFKFRRKYDRMIVNDEHLYRDHQPYPELEGDPECEGAIGAVFKTDIMTMLLDKLPGVGYNGALDIEGQKAAGPAITSFGEFIKVAAARELDVDPAELRVGTQNWRLDSCVTRQLYVADALENGAGYSRHICDPTRLRDLIKTHYEDVKKNWHDPTHADCDRSCPDCLRNYNNRFLHASLDWRLALDVAELVLGESLDVSRWLGNAKHIGTRFADLCNLHDGKVYVEEADWLVAITRGNSLSLVLSHPLWHMREGLAQDAQRNAKLVLQANHGSALKVEFVDIRDLAQHPQTYIVKMLEAQ